MVRSQLFTHLDQTDEWVENHATKLPKYFPLLQAQSQQNYWNHKVMLKMSSFTMYFSLLLRACERAYISALRDFETHQSRDKEKLIKLSVGLQALLVIVNRKISCSPAISKNPRGLTLSPRQKKERKIGSVTSCIHYLQWRNRVQGRRRWREILH